MDFDMLVKEAYENEKYSKVINLIEDKLKTTKEKLSEENLKYYLKSLSYFGIYDRALKYLRQKTSKTYRPTKNNYNNVRIINKELSKGNISESTLFDYLISLIKIGEFENANKILNNIRKLYPEYIDDFMFTIMLIRCNKYMEAKKIVDNSNFNGNQLFKIGITFYTIGQYRLAKKTIEEATIEGFSKHYDELYKKIHNTIEIHNKTNQYVSMNYEYFRLNNELSEGDIIYVSDVDEQYKEIDSYALKRTYMIWKIEGETVYAFPVTNKVPKDIRCYKLFRQNYLNFDSDRTVKSYIVEINKKYIQKVQERLTREDYLNVLSNIYSGIIVLGDEEKKQMMQPFVDETYNSFNIEINNVVVAYNKEEKKAKNYLVVDMDEESLYCIEVRINANYAYPMNYNIKKIDKRTELLRINTKVKVSDNKKHDAQKVLEKTKNKK